VTGLRGSARKGLIAAAGALLVTAVLLSVPLVSSGGHSTRLARPTLTHGIASGDVTATSAAIWARADGPARIEIEISPRKGFSGARRLRAFAKAATDYAVTVDVGRLRPGTRYHYRIRARADGVSRALIGTFRTAPASRRPAAVRFVFGAEVGSGNYCRHEQWGLPIFYYMSTLRPDFFIALGDMIYADSTCRPDGPGDWRNLPNALVDVERLDWRDRERLREAYRDHWRYTRADRHMRYFLARVPIYSLWDDHEVINDSGAAWDYWVSSQRNRPGYANIVAAGRDAFFAYGGIRGSAGEPVRLYRSFRWGKHAELFLLDTRSYRSRNDLPDTPENRKTMLGPAQLSWLKRSLARSTATWKIVASSVPVTIPTGSELLGRDAWSNGGHTTGFERELLDLLRHLDARSVDNVFFVTGDQHFAQILRSSKDYDGDREMFVFHEFVAGPLNARLSKPVWLDPTTNPTPLYGDGGFFNFGHIVVRPSRGRARLEAEVRDGTGAVRPGSRVVLAPRS
jgi:alkaline phosphatase D